MFDILIKYIFTEISSKISVATFFVKKVALNIMENFMKKTKEKNCRLGVVGGQAVLEGVMMKHGDRYSVAVRKGDGTVEVVNDKHVSLRKKNKFFNLPLIRGVVNMIEMLILSVKTLNVSAEMYGLEEEGAEETKFEKWMKKKFGDKAEKVLIDAVMVIGVVLGLALAVGLFIFLPGFLTGLIDKYLAGGSLGFWRNWIEGGLKICIFIAYLLLCSLMKDMRRTFEYHGAEHKSIFCYEAGEELTPENVKKHRRFHPRCGTSFMFVIILIGIFVSMLPIISWENVFLRTATKLLFLPIIVGLGFEFIAFAGKHDNFVTRALSAPGLLMQRITTREPDLEQIEVAIHALKSSMPEEFPDYVCPERKESSYESKEASNASEMTDAQTEPRETTNDSEMTKSKAEYTPLDKESTEENEAK